MIKFNHYQTFIDPLLSKAHFAAVKMVKKGETIIDIACGNGTLSMLYSNVAKQVTAVDLS